MRAGLLLLLLLAPLGALADATVPAPAPAPTTDWWEQCRVRLERAATEAARIVPEVNRPLVYRRPADGKIPPSIHLYADRRSDGGSPFFFFVDIDQHEEGRRERGWRDDGERTTFDGYWVTVAVRSDGGRAVRLAVAHADRALVAPLIRILEAAADDCLAAR